MYKPSFVPCEGKWSVGVGGRICLTIGERVWEVPDHQMALIYTDLLRAYDEIYGRTMLSTVLVKAKRLVGRFRKERRMVDSSTQLSDEELRVIFASIGPNGKRVMLEVCRRIKRGHDTYGDFPKRAWSQERRDELFDAMVYEVAEDLQRDGRIEDI
jgi:hypothetical protein